MSKKEIKIRWNQFDKNWNKLPMIILKKAISEQKQFLGEVTFSHKTTESNAKKAYQLDPIYRTPLILWVNIFHKKAKIIVEICWNQEWKREHNVGRYEIKLHSITMHSKYRGDYELAKKMTGSQFVEGALMRVQEVFEKAINIVEMGIIEAKKEKIKETKAAEYRENLSDEFGITLIPHSYDLDTYIYGKGQAFGLMFERVVDSEDPEEDEFYIRQVKGVFGKEEIKQLIKIIGGNPKAVASRLINNK